MKLTADLMGGVGGGSLGVNLLHLVCQIKLESWAIKNISNQFSLSMQIILILTACRSESSSREDSSNGAKLILLWVTRTVQPQASMCGRSAVDKGASGKMER